MGCNRPGGCACRTGEDGATCDWNTSARSIKPVAKPAPLDALLAKRKTTHGEYADDARAAMALVEVVLGELAKRQERGQPALSDIQVHSLFMNAFKVARIITGDADFLDHWDDIAGYAKLVSDRLAKAKALDDEVLTPEKTGCADDCAHPSHRHGRPGRRADEQNERPPNGAGVLGKNDDPTTKPQWGKRPCPCRDLDRCCKDEGIYVGLGYFCRKAEADKTPEPYAKDRSRMVPRYCY